MRSRQLERKKTRKMKSTMSQPRNKVVEVTAKIIQIPKKLMKTTKTKKAVMNSAVERKVAKTGTNWKRKLRKVSFTK